MGIQGTMHWSSVILETVLSFKRRWCHLVITQKSREQVNPDLAISLHETTFSRNRQSRKYCETYKLCITFILLRTFMKRLDIMLSGGAYYLFSHCELEYLYLSWLIGQESSSYYKILSSTHSKFYILANTGKRQNVSVYRRRQ